MSRLRSPAYLDWVGARPCARCGRTGATQAHHVKGTGGHSGVGLKAPDHWAMPLCLDCHTTFHGNPWPGAADAQYRYLTETLAAFVEAFEGMFPDTFELVAKVLAERDG